MHKRKISQEIDFPSRAIQLGYTVLFNPMKLNAFQAL
jgi:hypothetical protein